MAQRTTGCALGFSRCRGQRRFFHEAQASTHGQQRNADAGDTYLPVQAQGFAAARIDVAQALPPALAGAIQTYLEARAALQGAEAAGEEDTTAAAQHLSAAEGELSALCAAIGQPDIEACIALAQSGGFETPAPQPEAVPEPEPQPEPIAEPTPEPGAGSSHARPPA